MFERCHFVIAFYYYQDSLFDVSIHLEYKRKSNENIFRDENFYILEAPLNSSILSKTLEEGSLIKQLIFLNTDDKYREVNVINYSLFHILFSANTLTIDCYEIKNFENHLEYLQILFELWPGLILRLKGFKYCNEERLDWIQRLLIYCEGSPLCCKLSFSKVVMNIDIDKIRNIESFVVLNKMKHLYDSLSKIYDVELRKISYEDLFIKLF